MIVVVCNLLLLTWLVLITLRAIKINNRSMFYEPTLITFLFFFVIPISITLLNFTAYLMTGNDLTLIACAIPLLAPLFFTIILFYSNWRNNVKYKKISTEVKPVVIQYFKSTDFDFDESDVNLTYYKQSNEKRLDIRIRVNHNSDDSKTIRSEIEKMVNRMESTSNVISKVFLEKKNKNYLVFT